MKISEKIREEEEALGNRKIEDAFREPIKYYLAPKKVFVVQNANCSPFWTILWQQFSAFFRYKRGGGGLP